MSVAGSPYVQATGLRMRPPELSLGIALLKSFSSNSRNTPPAIGRVDTKRFLHRAAARDGTASESVGLRERRGLYPVSPDRMTGLHLAEICRTVLATRYALR